MEMADPIDILPNEDRLIPRHDLHMIDVIQDSYIVEADRLDDLHALHPILKEIPRMIYQSVQRLQVQQKPFALHRLTSLAQRIRQGLPLFGGRDAFK